MSASARDSVSGLATPKPPTADGGHTAPVDTLMPALIPALDTNITQKYCWERRGGCACRCHCTSAYSGSFISLVYQGFSPLKRCNEDTCNSRRYVLNLRLALSRLGLPLAILPSLQLIIDRDCRPQILPSLQMQRTCKYTSRGFHALYLLEYGFSTFDREASTEQVSARFLTYQQDKLAEIKQLFHDGEVSPLDVDPAGATWLEVVFLTLHHQWTVSNVRQKLLRNPWGVGHRWVQYDLLQYLVSRSKQDIRNNTRSVHIASFVGAWLLTM
jgi:hypothetical protein